MSTSHSFTVEHVVLFRVRPATDPSKVDTMISTLRAQCSFPSVSYISAGPILHFRTTDTSESAFTHVLHSRHESKEKLSEYLNDPEHMKVVKRVLEICDEILPVDWISEGLVPEPVAPGSALQVAFLKPKEGSDASELTLASAKNAAEGATLLSYGSNINPTWSKGYSFGMLAVFPGVEDLEKLERGPFEAIKETVQPMLDSVIDVDFVVSEPLLSTSDL